MKKITLILLSAALLLCTGLSGCTDYGSKEQSLTPEERTQLYETAITSARDQELNEAIPVLTDASDDTAQLIFPMLGLTAEDMEAFAIAVSPMNIRAYAVAAIYPAAEREDAVWDGLDSFRENQKQSFEQYLADQYEIAVNARLETLEDGTILLVMCEDQDDVFDDVRDAIVGQT